MTLCDTPNPTQQSSLNRSSKDKFLLVLNLPLVLREEAQTNKLISLEPLEISIHGTVVPTIQAPEIDVRYSGQTVHVSSYSRPAYAPLAVNFIVDNKFRNYYLLWKWLDYLNLSDLSLYGGTDPSQETLKRRFETGLISEYQTNFSIIGLNEYNKKTIEFKYGGCFISSLGSINYSYRDPELIESSAEFHFTQLDVELTE